MKKLFCLVLLFAQSAFAQGLSGSRDLSTSNVGSSLPSVYDSQITQSSFFFKPALSIEYNAPRISESGVNSEFKSSGTIFHQMGHLQNIALGGNFRVHQHLGFNANWVQSDMTNSELQGMGTLSNRAQFKFDQYNFSALFYTPKFSNLFEAFFEGGVADMRSKLTYNNVRSTSHQTLGFYGVGLQMYLSEKDVLRLSWQKYAGRIALINSEYSTMRIGYLRSF